MSEEPKDFLTTPRALSACAREFARLGDCLDEGVTASFGDVIDRKSMTVRRSPERCIIQVGHSAVTVAWIRSRRDSAEGELLIIHWHGIVAPAIHQQFERARELALSAKPVRETVFVAEATSEADWMWRSREQPLDRYSSLSLSALVIERLRIEYDAVATRVAI